MPLLSVPHVPQLCKSKLTIKYKGETVEVSDKDSNILITDFLDPVKNLFMVSINGVAEEQQRMNSIARFSVQRVDTKYRGTIQSMAFYKAQHTAVNAYNIEYVPALILYLHATAGFLVKYTWLLAINKG